VEPAVTFVVRAGTLLTVLAFAVSFRRSHDRQASELQRMASTDALTGLANRVELDRALDRALNRVARFERRGALVFVDIDDMKGVNDTLGHFAGDSYLRQIADRIRSVTRGIDTPARFGGDEFVVLLSEFDDPKGGEIFARKLLGVLSTPCLVEGHELVPSASIGIAPFPQAGDSPDTILRLADAAMYRAKRAGGGRIFVHHPEGAQEVR
jgi:diguanylate cyclase (GGDEF)-like protein